MMRYACSPTLSYGSLDQDCQLSWWQAGPDLAGEDVDPLDWRFGPGSCSVLVSIPVNWLIGISRR
ncbi:MAG: hypothetical protein Q7O66_04185, partial [Dehalococcoidia bacterium]|nr:hypothetical protein [Dehalococcoidia bacterium]